MYSVYPYATGRLYLNYIWDKKLRQEYVPSLAKEIEYNWIISSHTPSYNMIIIFT